MTNCMTLIKKIFAVMTQRSSAWPSVLPPNQLILLFLQVHPKIYHVRK